MARDSLLSMAFLEQLEDDVSEGLRVEVDESIINELVEIYSDLRLGSEDGEVDKTKVSLICRAYGCGRENFREGKYKEKFKGYGF